MTIELYGSFLLQGPEGSTDHFPGGPHDGCHFLLSELLRHPQAAFAIVLRNLQEELGHPARHASEGEVLDFPREVAKFARKCLEKADGDRGMFFDQPAHVRPPEPP